MLLVILFFEHQRPILSTVVCLLLVFRLIIVEFEDLVLVGDLFLCHIAKVVREDTLDRRRWPVGLPETRDAATLRSSSAHN